MTTLYFSLRALAAPLLVLAVFLQSALLLGAAEEKRTYSLEAADATISLEKFQEQSGEQLVYPFDAVRGVRTNAVAGTYTAREAIDLMLAGTGLSAVRDAQTGAFAVNRTPPAVDRSERSAPSSDRVRNREVSSENDEPLMLSPFEVQADPEDGYGSSSSVSLSRVATRVTEIPASILVINEKLIEDTMAVSIADTLELVAGVQTSDGGSTGNQTQNEFSVRGYSMSSAQRDGVTDALFTANGGFDYSFVERIEVAKGPNGIIYGNHSPGGVVNIISKRPRVKPFTKISFMAGADDFYRVELDTSNFFDKERRFGYRLAAAWWDTDGPVGLPGDPKKGFLGINPSLIYRAKSGLQVWAWSTIVRSSTSRAAYITRGFALEDQPSNVPGVNVPEGVALLDRTFLNEGGGNSLITSYNKSDTDSYEIGASHGFDFGPVRADFRVIARYRDQFSDGSRVRALGSDVFVAEDGTNIGTESRRIGIDRVTDGKLAGIYRNQALGYDYRPSETTRYDYSIDANFRFDIGKTRHQVLLTASYGEGDRFADSATYQVSGATAASRAALTSLGYELVGNTPRIWVYPLNKVIQGITAEDVINNANVVNTVSQTTGTEETYRFGALERMSFWDDRVFLVGGVNYTSNTTDTTSVVSNVNVTRQINTDRTWTPGYAAVYKFYKGKAGEAALFANFNRTYVPVYTLDRRLPTLGQRLPNRNAKANEVGIKLDFPKKRLTLTASVFDNEEDNALVSLLDPDGSITGVPNNTYQAPVGVRTTRGWDVALNFRPARGWDILAGFADVKGRLQDGSIPPGIAETSLSLMVRYAVPRGRLKGLSANWIYKAWGREQNELQHSALDAALGRHPHRGGFVSMEAVVDGRPRGKCLQHPGRAHESVLDRHRGHAGAQLSDDAHLSVLSLAVRVRRVRPRPFASAWSLRRQIDRIAHVFSCSENRLPRRVLDEHPLRATSAVAGQRRRRVARARRPGRQGAAEEPRDRRAGDGDHG